MSPQPGPTDSSSQRMKINQRSLGHLQQWCQVGGQALGPGNNSTLFCGHHGHKVSGSHWGGGMGAQSCACAPACPGSCAHTQYCATHGSTSESFGGTQPPAGKVETELEKQPLVTVDGELTGGQSAWKDGLVWGCIHFPLLL